MTRSFACVSGLVLALFATSAWGQQVIISPGASQVVIPPPAKVPLTPLPSVGPAPQPNAVPTRPPSFSDRVVGCLQQGAAAGLGPNERAAYSRSCANQQ